MAALGCTDNSDKVKQCPLHPKESMLLPVRVSTTLPHIFKVQCYYDAAHALLTVDKMPCNRLYIV